MKPILPSAEVIVLGRRSKSNSVPHAKTLKVLPKFPRCDNAFYSYNKALKKKKGVANLIQQAIYKSDFAGNGARGRMTHTKENLEKVAGNKNIKKKPKKVKEIELDSQAVEEQSQMNFDGTDLRGKRVTSAEEAKAFIKKFGGSIKYNRGEHYKTGRFSGGVLRRTYERETRRLSSAGDNVQKEDEFHSLQESIQEEQTDLNIKPNDEGM